MYRQMSRPHRTLNTVPNEAVMMTACAVVMILDILSLNFLAVLHPWKNINTRTALSIWGPAVLRKCCIVIKRTLR